MASAVPLRKSRRLIGLDMDSPVQGATGVVSIADFDVMDISILCIESMTIKDAVSNAVPR